MPKKKQNPTHQPPPPAAVRPKAEQHPHWDPVPREVHQPPPSPPQVAVDRKAEQNDRQLPVS